MKKTPATPENPYAVRLRDGRVLADSTYQNSEEQVRLYGAAWINADQAFTAIAAERAARRAPVTVDASEVR